MYNKYTIFDIYSPIVIDDACRFSLTNEVSTSSPLNRPTEDTQEVVTLDQCDPPQPSLYQGQTSLTCSQIIRTPNKRLNLASQTGTNQ